MMVGRPLSGEKFARLTVAHGRWNAGAPAVFHPAHLSFSMFSRKRTNPDAQGTASFPSELLNAAWNEGSPTKVSKRDSLWYGKGRRPATKRKKHAESEKRTEGGGVDDPPGWQSEDSRSTVTMGSSQVDDGSAHSGSDAQRASSPSFHEGLGSCAQPLIDPATDSEPDELGSDSSNHDEELEIYVDSVNSEVAGFDYIGGKVYVVQGWDSVRRKTTVSPSVHQSSRDAEGSLTGRVVSPGV